jgi:hypothetical protein
MLQEDDDNLDLWRNLWRKRRGKQASKQETQKRVRSLQRLPLFADRPPVPSLFRVRSVARFPQTYVGRCSFPPGRRPLSHRCPAVADIPCCIANLPFPGSQKNCAKFRRNMTYLFFPFLFFFLFLFFGYLKIPFSSPHSEEKNMGVAIFKHWVPGDRQNIARF